MAEITLTRPTGYRVDSGREYQIVIDRKKAGSIKNGETKVFTLPPGRHEVQLKQDWASSEKLRVDLGEDEQAQFVCAPRIKENDVGMVNGLRVIYWATLGCRRYIDLRQGNDLAPADEPISWLQKFDGPKLFGIALLIGIAYWVVTGQSVVVIGVLVASMALVVSGFVGRGIGKVAVQVNQEVQKRRGG
jgi:hypothetical protein